MTPGGRSVRVIGAAWLALAVGACGDEAKPERPRQAVTTTGAASPEDELGGAGDEEPARVPAVFTVTSTRVTPSTVTVPAFLAIELDLTSGDGRLHEVRVGRTTLAVPPAGRVTQTIEGLRPGRQAVVVDGRRSAAALVVGGEPGP